MVAAENWYFSTNYDLAGTEIPGTFTRVTLPSAIWRIFTSSARVLEVPEPLWARFLPTNVAILVAWRLSGFVRFQNRKGRTYAIENGDPVVAMFGARAVPQFTRFVTTFVLGVLVRALYERVALGTNGAADAYGKLWQFSRVNSTVIEGIPSSSGRRAGDQPSVPVLAFVGELHLRKGIDRLLAAWPDVEKRLPGARILIIGAGALDATVRSWVELRPGSREFLGQVPHRQIADILQDTTAIAVPSQRYGRWREQVGLPIEEGLAIGLTIVTSSETGLANWLTAHGHHVVEPGDAASLTEAIIMALETPLPRQSVVDSLPALHGRIVADSWLHS